MANPTGSVFCSHGAGFVVNWNQVEDYMHLESPLHLEIPKMQEEKEAESSRNLSWKEEQAQYAASEKELEEIFLRTYGSAGKGDANEKRGFRRKHQNLQFQAQRSHDGETYLPKKTRKPEEMKQYLLVDGYNIIFAWEELKALAESNIDAARDKLIDLLCDYQGYKQCNLILVFDAYKVQGNQGSVQKIHDIYVVFTKEAETADQYIEKTVHEMGRKYQVTVATSDRLEQVIILGQGAARISAREFLEEILQTRQKVREDVQNRRQSADKNYLFDHLDEELADYMEQVRLGKKELK